MDVLACGSLRSDNIACHIHDSSMCYYNRAHNGIDHRKPTTWTDVLSESRHNQHATDSGFHMWALRSRLDSTINELHLPLTAASVIVAQSPQSAAFPDFLLSYHKSRKS